MPGEIRRIANLLEIEPTDWDAVLEHSSFEWMKANAEICAPGGGVIFEGGARTFINKGLNGRRRDALPEADSAAFEARARAELGEDCAKWLASGRLGWPAGCVRRGADCPLSPHLSKLRRAIGAAPCLLSLRQHLQPIPPARPSRRRRRGHSLGRRRRGPRAPRPTGPRSSTSRRPAPGMA